MLVSRHRGLLVTLGSEPGLSFPFLSFGAATSYRLRYSTLNIRGVNGTRVILLCTRVFIHNHIQTVLYTYYR